MVICSCDRCLIATNSAAMSAHMVPMTPMMTLLRRLIRWNAETAMSPASEDRNVAMRIDRKMSAGLAAPICARYTITPMGMMVSPDVLRTRNIIMELDASSFLGLISCSSFMALRPKGVAALSSPSMLAAMFMKMLPDAGWFLGMSGKIFEKKGVTMREKACIAPPFSPIFIIPNHRASTPVSPSDMVNPLLAESNVAFIMSGNTDVSPNAKRRMHPTMNAIRRNPIQI